MRNLRRLGRHERQGLILCYERTVREEVVYL
jgi:hypothetical protein